MCKMAALLLLLVFIASCSALDAFFTSVGHMTDLLYTEQHLLASLKDYIHAEENKLEQIKKWAEHLDDLSGLSLQDPEGFLGHPVNAFKLMKRLRSEWAEVETLVLTNVSDGFISDLTVGRQHFPNEVDQTGVAEALLRLQDTYELDTNTLAKGELPGSSSLRSPLTADDCYDLAMVAYQENDFYHTELWMSQALRQLDQGEPPGAVDAVTILDYLSYALYQLGELESAVAYTKRLLKLDPSIKQAEMNLHYFEYHLDKMKKGEETEETLRMGGAEPHLDDDKTYEKLCRGKSTEMTSRRQSRLFCRYHDSRRHPRYVIGPVKEEDEWDRPRVVRYHDIATDEEMSKFKELAKPRLTRSKVVDSQAGHSYEAGYRISENAWLGQHEHPVVNMMVQRIGDITGLDVSTAEQLQVANYGVGGQYEAHYDFNREDESDSFAELGTGNRIATWLLYMSDVQAGGATVFTDAGAAVWPKKGTAVFWYNLHPSGDGDYRTKHAACPVLVGSKWVANLWLHERGQEFRRPCPL
ncbi:prolyl 4-hydroxylase subunit alpha-1-like isoform X1 [Entelurus aequoreus]|uniref:prolyl 4-hydroxylase subunit alpha-1-like isoform X1 n=2 Tax=Entelurus aequoreus TaxID=161455 RepID=UPI002B1DFFE5|nr:prolyl 4-hydroxylase subunit alpha-1-like isoform X1 [Entelurus aequoreus]